MPAKIIVAVFQSRHALTRALAQLQETPDIDVERAAVVARARNGEVIVVDDNISPDEGGIAGSAMGAAMTAWGLVQLGALALPGVGAIIAIGGAVLVGGLLGRWTGRFAANLLDFGYQDSQIAMLADNLEAGHPALVLELGAAGDLSALRRLLRPFNADVIEPLHRAALPAPPAGLD